MTQYDPLRVGLIGAGGRWGPRAHVPALKGVSEVDLYAVCTTHADTAQNWVRIFTFDSRRWRETIFQRKRAATVKESRFR